MTGWHRAGRGAQGSRTGMRTQAAWAACARATNCGNDAGGVFSKYPSVSPVAGFIEGSESTEMAVAAISGFYMKTSRNRRGRHKRSRGFALPLPNTPHSKIVEDLVLTHY